MRAKTKATCVHSDVVTLKGGRSFKQPRTERIDIHPTASHPRTSYFIHHLFQYLNPVPEGFKERWFPEGEGILDYVTNSVIKKYH